MFQIVLRKPPFSKTKEEKVFLFVEEDRLLDVATGDAILYEEGSIADIEVMDGGRELKILAKLDGRFYYVILRNDGSREVSPYV